MYQLVLLLPGLSEQSMKSIRVPETLRLRGLHVCLLKVQAEYCL